jgi:hypothetical protein
MHTSRPHSQTHTRTPLTCYTQMHVCNIHIHTYYSRTQHQPKNVSENATSTVTAVNFSPHTLPKVGRHCNIGKQQVACAISRFVAPLRGNNCLAAPLLGSTPSEVVLCINDDIAHHDVSSPEFVPCLVCWYSRLHKNWGSRNGFQRFLVSAYHWKTVEKQVIDLLSKLCTLNFEALNYCQNRSVIFRRKLILRLAK